MKRIQKSIALSLFVIYWALNTETWLRHCNSFAHYRPVHSTPQNSEETAF